MTKTFISFIAYMNYKEALKEVYYERKYALFRFEWKSEFESDDPNPGPVEHHVRHPSKMLFTLSFIIDI